MAAGILFGVLFLLLFVGVPIAICLGIAAAVTMVATGNIQYLAAVPTRMFTQVDNSTLMAVPFFILAGNIMAEGGISDRLIGFFELLLKRLPGRLACISVVASGFFGAISGSNPATVAAIGGICAPRMIQKGYPPAKAAAIAASAGTLGVVIPPSIPMVTYAVTANESIIDMFEAGWVPGIMLIVGLCVANVIMCRKYDSVDNTAYPAREYLIRFKDAFLALLMPIIILGGIYSGMFTPTESAAVACVYALIVSCLVFRELPLKKLYKVFIDSCVSSAVVLFVVSMSAPFAWFMTSENIPAMISTAVMNAFSNKFLILLVMNLLLLFLGCFIGSMQILIMVAPLLMNLANALNMSYIQMGVMAVLNVTLGLITPPMAPALFVTAKATGNNFESALKYTVQFLIPMFATLMLVTFWEPLTMWLPRLLGAA